MASPAKRQRTTDEKQAFVDVCKPLIEEVLADAEKLYPDYDKEALGWFRYSMEYNCLGGKMNRGLSVLNTFKHLSGGRDVTEQEAKEANMLGWTIEWLQAFFLVSDDIMDASITRRGQPCWYKKDGPPCKGWEKEPVGMVAINDAFLIESAIYKVLKAHFRSKEYYVDLLELMHEVTYQTELGQMLDLITAPEDHVDLSKFSVAKYKCIVKYKTAFYSFYLPVAMGMMMAGVTDKTQYANALEILLEMGEFFQIQDDYLDCYGAPETIGKIGTDIQDNKCGWLVVKALEKVTPEQMKILEESYGKKNSEDEAKVKALYLELGMEKVFKDYEVESYARLQQLIKDKAGDLPVGIFEDFAKKIYKRTK